MDRTRDRSMRLMPPIRRVELKTSRDADVLSRDFELFRKETNHVGSRATVRSFREYANQRRNVALILIRHAKRQPYSSSTRPDFVKWNVFVAIV